MIYAQLARFLFPLVLTMVVYGLSGQVLNGGMARVPRATETLAAFGLAWGVTDFLASPISQVRQVGLVLATSTASLRRVRNFVLVAGLGLSAILPLLGMTQLGNWVIEDLHGVEAGLGKVVRSGILYFSFIPILEAWNRFYSGLLLQVRRTEIVSLATLAGIGANILAVFALLPLEWVRHQPILLPVVAVYAGYAVNLGILFRGYQRCVKKSLPTGESGELTYLYILKFFWPLALVMAIQGFSRPLINLFVSRGADGKDALAALAVVYSLAHLLYGWVNEIRSLPAAFKQVPDHLRYIRRFAGGCGLLSFVIMMLMFWTPLRDIILIEWIGIGPELAALCATPLFLFTFFPLAVMVRGYVNGIALVEHRTRALAPSAPSRIGIILVVLMVLPGMGISGATLGVTALLFGFVLEATVVWVGVRGWQRWFGRAQ
ncbi:MAG: hypothetical protein HOC74_31910 [Gemmatimonadetes bacterium]|nr:hypothetical protein [Gemmatimonadota bacterium]